MIKAQGTVVRADNMKAYVRLQKQSACGSCAEQSACGVAALGKVFGRKDSELEFVNKHKLAVGDQVTVGLPEQDLFSIAIRSYLLPLLGFFIFAVVGTFLKNYWSFPSELFVVGFAVLGLVASYRLLKARTYKARLEIIAHKPEQTVNFQGRINES